MPFFYQFRHFSAVLFGLWAMILALFPFSFAQAQNAEKQYILKIKPEKRFRLENQTAWISFLEKQLQTLDKQTFTIRPLFPTPKAIAEIDFLFEINFAEKDLNQVLLLAQNSEIAYIEASNLYKPASKNSYLPNDPAVQNGSLWGHRLAKVYDAWSLSKGDSNVVIGIIDTGFDIDHEDLRKQVKYNWKEKFGKPNFDDDGNGFEDDSLGYDFGEDDPNARFENLNATHGTQVAGVASATPDNRTGGAGTGFNCRFMPIKIYTRNSIPNTANLCKAIRYAAENGCQIINMSLFSSLGVFSQSEQEVIDYAALEKNVLLIASAGNDENPNLLYYPASYQHVLSVSSSNKQDEHIQLVRNKHIDLLAPGDKIYTTAFLPDKYTTDFGESSSASPFVAGVAGLLKSAFPNLTGLQIGEILRQTANDSIYVKSKNAPYKGLLGKGRIDALKAFTHRNAYSSVRTLSARYQDRFGNYAFRDDTIQVFVNFKNYLKPTSQKLNITISSNSPYVTILQNQSTLRTLGTLDSASVEKPFLIYLKPNLPASARIEFEVRIENTDYQDIDFVQIVTSPEYITPQLNQLSLTVASNGRLGFADEEGKIGEGLIYKGSSVLQEAGLMIGISPNEVPNVVRINNTRKSNDFKYSQNIRYMEKAQQEAQLHCSFADTTRTKPTGLIINQRISAKTNTPHQEYLFLDYEIHNTSSRHLDSLFVGFFADWKIGYGLNKADWDETDKFGYVYDAAGYMGIKVIWDDLGYYAFDKVDVGGNDINLTRDFTIAKKYETMSKGIAKKQAGYMGFGNPVAHVLSAKIRNLTANGKQKLTFIIAAGRTLEILRQNFASALAYRNPQSSKSTIPVLQTNLCDNNPITIRPKNGTKFRFYESKDLANPIHIGNFMTVIAADTAKIFYVSNADSVLESQLVKYQFRLYKPKARFESADLLNLVDSTKMRFFDKSTRAVAWSWNFGDDSETVFGKNVVHEFKKVGNYTVSLTITDSTGCHDVFKKIIQVKHLSKGFVPVVPAKIIACQNDTLRIRPTNGTKFRFFTNLNAKKVVFEGREFLLTDSQVDTVFVSNLDSAFESNQAKIYIQRSRFKPHFTTRPTADTLFFSQVQFLLDSASSRFTFTTVEWDFGEGFATVKATNPTYKYQKQGVYNVTMRIFDVQGCKAEVQKIFKVGRKSPYPNIQSFAICDYDSAVVAPQNGSRFAFYRSLAPLQKVHEGKFYKFKPQETQELWIQNLDSIVESDIHKIRITVNHPSANFLITDPSIRNPRNQVVFIDNSPNAIKWDWDFEDGKRSSLQYPIHLYDRQGFYSVTLTMTDWNGCQAKITKIAKVEAESPVPQIAQIIPTCTDTQNVLAPQGGSLFRFYQFPVLSLPVSEGKTFDIGRLTSNVTYYITCIDSMIESRPAVVEYRVQKPEAGFSMNTEVLDLRESKVLELKAKKLGYKTYFWDFGNGTNSTLPNPSAKYENGGIYTIRLTVTDSLNCQAYSERTLTVTPELQPANPNSKITLYPNPNNGFFNVALELGLPKKAVFKIYNTLGMEVWAGESEDFAQKKSFWLSLRRFPSGLYVFCAWLDGHLYKTNFLIEQ